MMLPNPSKLLACCLGLTLISGLAAYADPPTPSSDAEVRSYLQKISAARTAKKELDIRNALLDAFAAFGPIVTKEISARNYAAAESILNQWSETLESAKGELLDRQLLLSHSRLQASLGTFEESKGQEAYILNGDFVNAPRILKKAEDHHERSAEFASRVEFPADAPPQAKAMKEGIVSLQKAEVLRVRGLRLLYQGEFEAEAGALDQAISLLQESLTVMRKAEADPQSPAPSDAVSAISGKGLRDLNLIDYAEALLHKTRSEAALLAGNLVESATEQQARAESLQRSQSMLLRTGQHFNESFSRRLARDIYVAQQRHDHLLAEAAKRPKNEWIKAVVFFIMSIGSVIMILRFSQGQWFKNKAILALLLFFIMAIAGVGARLVEWKEAASMFRGS